MVVGHLGDFPGRPQAVAQSRHVRHLDRQSRPRIEFQQHRAGVLVQDDIGADVAQPGHLHATGGQVQDAIPVGHMQLAEMRPRIRVDIHQLTVLHRAHGAAAVNVEAHTYRALVQVGLAVRRVGGAAHHRHHRHAAEGDYPDVGHALVAVLLQVGVEVDQPLDHGAVIPAAQAVQAGKYVRQVAAHFIGTDQGAAGLAVEVTLAADDNQDTLAAAALYRLDDKGGELLQGADSPGDLVLVLDGAEQLGNRDAVGQGGLLGQQLVIHQGIVAARIVLADKAYIAPVHAENTQLPEPARRDKGDHCCLSRSRKRYSSDRR